ncbi:hypothetical protein CWI37_0088p0010 [Hamiltosporidium tvaerminnensis]|uniref:Uncharacterized protein n=1 Tax=Hamiltosporidium tvaerminnensis TaxID=1176355 RepID=A0A4Q9LAJ6_9MICR|nr:hypothetical protein CWI37_0088p0010 [Hamiltosporidium tvaerminnensis]
MILWVMLFWKTKEFRIAAIVVFGITTVCLIIGCIGYYKAGNAIKDFEEDFKKVSEKLQFKNNVLAFENIRYAVFMNSIKYKFFMICEIHNNNIPLTKPFEEYNRSNISEPIKDSTKKFLTKIRKAFESSNLFSFDTSGFLKVIPNLGFFVRIGLLIRKKHPFLDVYKAFKSIGSLLNNSLENEGPLFIILKIVDDKRVLLNEKYLYSEITGIFCVKKILDFDSLKINGKKFVSSDFIIYIAEKVRKESKDIMDELRNNYFAP